MTKDFKKRGQYLANEVVYTFVHHMGGYEEYVLLSDKTSLRNESFLEAETCQKY
jgi:hypothetical protein